MTIFPNEFLIQMLCVCTKMMYKGVWSSVINYVKLIDNNIILL